MRKRKPEGNYKIHGHDECGICSKPRRYKSLQLDKEILQEQLDTIEEEPDNDVCGCGRVNCYVDYEF